jgi:hypothetical protein
VEIFHFVETREKYIHGHVYEKYRLGGGDRNQISICRVGEHAAGGAVG